MRLHSVLDTPCVACLRKRCPLLSIVLFAVAGASLMAYATRLAPFRLGRKVCGLESPHVFPGRLLSASCLQSQANLLYVKSQNASSVTVAFC